MSKYRNKENVELSIEAATSPQFLAALKYISRKEYRTRYRGEVINPK
jgi:hypothetical protein